MSETPFTPELLTKMHAAAIKDYDRGIQHPLAAFYELAAQLGDEPIGPERCCGKCHGSGWLASTWGGKMEAAVRCHVCGGRGYLMPWQTRPEPTKESK